MFIQKKVKQRMINKQSVSFKGVYCLPDINNLSDKNKAKVGVFAKLATQNFPANDIFLGADESGELYMKVQKANPLHLLMDEEIAARMNISPIQLAYLINFLSDLKSAYNNNHGIQQPCVMDKTDNIDDMDAMDLSFRFCRVIDLFNKLHKDVES